MQKKTVKDQSCTLNLSLTTKKEWRRNGQRHMYNGVLT